MLSSRTYAGIVPGVTPRRPPPGRPRRLLLVPLLAVGLLMLMAGTAGVASASQAGGSEHASHAINITTHGLRYDLSTTSVASGLVTTTLHNTGKQPHMAQIAKFKSGKSVTDFKTLLTKNPNAALGLFESFVGGPNVVVPGDSQTTIQNLKAGHYLLLCFVPDPMGTPHFAMGMYAPFQVIGEERHASVQASQKVFAVDPMQFVVPEKLRSDSVVRFENRATIDTHEFDIGRLHANKTAQDVETWAANPNSPPPFDFAGGAGALSPGGREWFTLDLAPGRYVVFCLVPDDKDGVPHASKGMVKEFTVVD
jgi:uncharacterized cupredoxin-like copper-binding protein